MSEFIFGNLPEALHWGSLGYLVIKIIESQTFRSSNVIHSANNYFMLAILERILTTAKFSFLGKGTESYLLCFTCLVILALSYLPRHTSH